jgi:hypothetical protein
LHLFKLKINGNDLIINLISTGYAIAIASETTTVTVSSDSGLGMLKSSAYPNDVDNWKDEEDNAITIKANKFVGQKGVIKARRSGVWLEGQEVNLNNKKSVKKCHTNGHEYDHFSAGGQVVAANRFVTILFPKADISGASLYSDQMVQIVSMNGSSNYIWSLASVIDAPHIFVYSDEWHLDTQVTYAGIPGVDPYAGGNAGSTAELQRRQAALTVNHDQTVLNYGRSLHYFVGNAIVLNDSEFSGLLGGDQAYGSYMYKNKMCPTFTSYTTVTVVQPSGGGRRGGGLGFGGFSGFGQHGNLGGSAFASMAASSTHVSAADFSVSNRGGAVNVGGSMTLASMLGNTSMGFGTTHGGGGSTTTLHSTFTPPSMAAAAAMIGNLGVDPVQLPPQMNPLLMLHGFNAQAIQLLTQPRHTHASATLKVLEIVGRAAHLGSRVTGVLKTGELVKEALEEGKQKLQDEQRRSGAAASGGPDGDDEDEKKYPENPKEAKERFKPLESGGAKENLEDGSVWEKDTSSHGGEQWKRWPNKRAWEKGETPTSVWPDGRVRK